MSDFEKEFQYALALTRSSELRDRTRAKHHLRKLMGNSKYSKDCMYYMAQVLYQEGAYSESRGYIEDLWRVSDPNNQQITSLHEAATQRHKEQERRENDNKTDQLTALGIAGAIAGAAAMFFLTKGKHNK